MNAKKKINVLIIYYEPTPYYIDILRILEKAQEINVSVFFLDVQISQSWGLDIAETHQVFPPSMFNFISVLIKEFRRKNIDIVHLPGWGNKRLLLIYIFSLLFRKKIIFESDTQLLDNIPVMKKIVKRMFYPLMFKFTDYFLPAGSRQAAYFEHYDVPKSKITKSFMTVDVNNITNLSNTFREKEREKFRNSLGFSFDSTVFVYVGRLESYKGIIELLQAFDELSRKKDNVYFLIVGNGSLKNNVEEYVNANPSIKVFGQCSQKEVINILSSADVCVVPSSRDAWGLVVIEAMACGLPVIATYQVGCVDDLIVNGTTGFIVADNQTGHILPAMEKVTSDHLLTMTMAKNAKQQISEWTLERESEIMISIWKKCLNQ